MSRATACYKNDSGMTLVELLVAALALSVLVEGVSYAYVMMLKGSKRTIAQSTVDQSLSDLSNYLDFRIQRIGGGSVRPWAALWVEDNVSLSASRPFPEGAGSDRVTLFENDPVLADCTISAVNPAAPVTLTLQDSTGACCLTAQHANRQAVLTNGGFYSQRFLTNLQLAPCTVQLQPGQAFGGINASPPLPSGEAAWLGGKLTVGNVSTLYLDATLHELHEFQDLNNNGAIDAGEDRVLTNRIMDLQFALGYDCNPQDGKLVDTGDANDEWLYNAPGITEVLGSGGLAQGIPSDMRMFSIGIIVGEKAPSAVAHPLSVLNGPTRQLADWQLNKTLVQFRFRNIGIFLQNG